MRDRALPEADRENLGMGQASEKEVEEMKAAEEMKACFFSTYPTLNTLKLIYWG